VEWEERDTVGITTVAYSAHGWGTNSDSGGGLVRGYTTSAWYVDQQATNLLSDA